MIKLKEKFKKSVSVIVLSAVMLAGCSSIDNQNANATSGAGANTADITRGTENTSAVQITTSDISPEITEAPAPKSKTVSFCAVGDNLIHAPIYNQAKTAAGYDFSPAYKNIADIIQKADLSVINQETLICNDMYEPSSYPCFNSPKALGDHMIDIGFDVFTLANNHCLDYGEKGLSRSMDYWDTKTQLSAGTYRNAEDKNKIRVGEYGGIKFSFLSYTQYTNGLTLPQGSEMIIGDTGDLDGMIADIKSAKQSSDVCVVALHWGIENSDVIEDWQRTYAKALADAGADIIIGNHPHVLRDIEEIERADGGKTLCAYSLGNFISAQSVGQNLIGGILEFNVTMTEGDKSASISDIRLIPIVTHYDGNYSDVRIYKLSDYTPELALAHGVRQFSTFNYDYIIEVLKENINEKYLVLP
ncbi:MAG TPA: capsular biosynthesis protein [Ruminococcaceae bacterium]|nr:capsular biosynthesis protein [Oscillospiraceae bacterium]